MPLNFPTSPNLNDVYSFGGKSWIWNGAAWALRARTTGILTVSDSPPSNPIDGDNWINSLNGRQLVYFNDGDSSQWVELIPSDPAVSSATIDFGLIDGAVTLTNDYGSIT